MTPASRAALAAALDDALVRAMADALWVPGVTVLVVDAADPEPAEVAIERMTRALDRAGIGTRRRLVLVPSRAGRVAERALVERYARAAASPAVAHDPMRSPSFSPGCDDSGNRLDVNDELREAELVIALAPRADGSREDAPDLLALIHPGLAPAGSATTTPDPASVRALVPIDFALVWSRREDGAWRIDAGAPH